MLGLLALIKAAINPSFRAQQATAPHGSLARGHHSTPNSSVHVDHGRHHELVEGVAKTQHVSVARVRCCCGQWFHLVGVDRKWSSYLNCAYLFQCRPEKLPVPHRHRILTPEASYTPSAWHVIDQDIGRCAADHLWSHGVQRQAIYAALSFAVFEVGLCAYQTEANRAYRSPQSQSRIRDRAGN